MWADLCVLPTDPTFECSVERIPSFPGTVCMGVMIVDDVMLYGYIPSLNDILRAIRSCVQETGGAHRMDVEAALERDGFPRRNSSFLLSYYARQGDVRVNPEGVLFPPSP